MDLDEMRRLLRRQSGLVSRRQLLELGARDSDVRRLVRRRELSRVHPGVFLEHTGAPTWHERAWAAVLACAPAALADASALRAHQLKSHGGADTDPIHLVVPGDRRVTAPSGVKVSRSDSFAADVLAHLSPPRLRVEVAVVRVAARAATSDAVVAVAADAVQARHTTVPRLRAAARRQRPTRGLAVLTEVLDDIASGAYSALERRYLRDVEQAHGLPHATRQRRISQGRAVHYRDVEYIGLATLVELDGRLGHEWAADRWADLERDLGNASSGTITLRAGWAQVLQPCRLARHVGEVLRARGWPGRTTRCGPDCLLSPCAP